MIDDVEEEQRQFAKVVSTFKNYAQYSLFANNRRRKDIYTLPRADQELLNHLGYKEKLEAVDKAILVNAELLAKIVEDTQIFDELENHGENEESGDTRSHGHSSSSQIFSLGSPGDITHSFSGPSHNHSHAHSVCGRNHQHGGPSNRPDNSKPSEFDMDKLRSTLKQFVRDWSEEGFVEREACYKPMKDALLDHFAEIPIEKRRHIRVLVPGAGLGRLAYDVAKLGFTCQGNEFSHYMLLSSFFILNKTDQLKSHTFYPYIHSFSNAPNEQSILQAISIPDVLPSDLPEGSDFSLVAGDFEEVYGSESRPGEPHAGEWDAIMTCFFIDTAKNIVNYLRIIHRILAPGGVWINLGPLLWHWENNNSNDPSIELDVDELKTLVRNIGFEISIEKTIDATYTNNAKSMLGYIYHASFWTATKV